MKANRRRREMRRDGDAVTNILGAILVSVIVVALLVTVRVSFVPVWEENAEASHMQEMSNKLAAFKAQLDRQTGNATATAEVSSELPLGLQGSSIFAQNRQPGILEYAPASSSGDSFNISAERLTVLLANGTLVPIADNEWEDIPTTTEVDDVEQVVALRIRIDEMDRDKVGEQVTITLTDSAGNHQGRFEVTVEDAPSQYLPTYSTYNAVGELLTRVSTTYHEATSFTPFYVNTLEPEYVFDQVLAAADTPLTITLTHSAGMPADYSIAYLKSDGTGQSVLVGGGGSLKLAYAKSFGSGTLTYTARNSYYVPQTYIIENGAIILDQTNGAAFKVKPNFEAVDVLGILRLTLTLPTISGDASTISGPRAATVFSSPRSGMGFSALAPSLNFTIATDYPILWANFFTTELESAGLSSDGSQPQFAVTPGTTNVTVAIYGPTADPGSTVNDISLSFAQANVRLRLEAA